jgi:hypothetical protein
VFEQYADMLHQKYPEISVEGDLYPLSDYKIVLARALVCEKFVPHFFIHSNCSTLQYILRYRNLLRLAAREDINAFICCACFN